MQHTQFAAEIKALEPDGTVRAYIATYRTSPDAQGDIIAPGAFTKSLMGKPRLPMLWQHDVKAPCGHWYDYISDSHGVLAIGKFNLSTDWGRNAYGAVKGEDLDSFSVGYTVQPGGASYDKAGVRHLTELDLKEASPVTFASDGAARLVGVKASTLRESTSTQQVLRKAALEAVAKYQRENSPAALALKAMVVSAARKGLQSTPARSLRARSAPTAWPHTSRLATRVSSTSKSKEISTQMNFTEIRSKIDNKAAELRKLEADEHRLTDALRAAEAEHVEALAAFELEEAGASGRVRKAEAELTKPRKAVEEAGERRKTLRAVLGRMDQEARSQRRADLLRRRMELAEAAVKVQPKYEAAVRDLIAVVAANHRTLDEIREIENELEGLVAPDRLNRASLESPHWVSIDLNNVLKYAGQVAVQNAQRLDGVKTEPVIPVQPVTA